MDSTYKVNLDLFVYTESVYIIAFLVAKACAQCDIAKGLSIKV